MEHQVSFCFTFCFFSLLNLLLPTTYANSCAGKEEFDDKQKEVEKVVNPIMSKLYAAGGGAGGSSSSGEDEEMPDHDELET